MLSANTLLEVSYAGIHDSPVAYQLLYPGMHELVAKRVPHLFISRPLVDAIKLSDFDAEIDWTEMKLPFESAVVMFPKGSIVHPVTGDAVCVIYNRSAAGEHPPPIPNEISGLSLPTIELQSVGLSFLVICLNENDPVWYDGHFVGSKNPRIRLNNPYNRTGDGALKQIGCVSRVDQNLDLTDADFLNGVTSLMFGLFYALECRPTLLIAEQLLRKPGKKHSIRAAQPEFWQPNIIGRDYRIKNAPQGGHHASPRAHWRRGHFKQQPFGPKRSERKRIWIEPTFVGVEQHDPK